MRPAAVARYILLIVACGCGRAETGEQPSTFDRANAVAFTCLDKEEGVLVPLDEDCATIDSDARFATIALVTQSARGQVASVDLATGRVLDTNPAVPGFNFQVVLPKPSGLALREDQPTFTYVASFGASRVQAIPTERFLPDIQPSGATAHDVLLPGPPTDIAISADGQALFVAIPALRTGPPPDAGTPTDADVPMDADITMDAEPTDAGSGDAGVATDATTDAAPLDASPTDTGPEDAGGDGGDDTLPTAGGVFTIPLDAEGRLGEPTPVALQPAVDPPDLRDLPTLPPSADVGLTQHACTPEPLEPPLPPAELTPPGLPPSMDMGEAHPVALEVDPFDDVLLVADDRLPLIHRIDVSTSPASALPPFAVGAPTRELALTPPVPTEPGEDTPGARYLFAIDDSEESVLVVDYTTGSPTEGAVLPVSAGGARFDRLLLPSTVTAIGVMTPDYDAMAAGAPGTRCTPGSDLEEDAGPTRLRGVFLAAGLSDGSLRVVDVHDLDLECRGFPGCVGLEEEQAVYYRRHVPRIQQGATNPFILTTSPLFRFMGASGRVGPDGMMERGEAPGLAPFDACPEGMRRAFPLEGDDAPVVCVAADPWATRAQRWAATWQGPIPGTAAQGFLRQGDTLELPGGGLCARGVVGSEDPPAHLPDYGGDAVVVTAPVAEGAPADCAELAEQDGDLAFRIRATHQTRLELGAPLGPATLDDVRRCFDEPVDFEVRTVGVYRVAGSTSGFLHRRDVAEDGSCVEREDRDPLLRGRALEGEPFRNSQVAFQIRPVDGTADALPPDVQLEVELSVGGASTAQQVQLGVRANVTVPVLPADVKFSSVLGRLYVVDRANRGLLELDPHPLRITRPFE